MERVGHVDRELPMITQEQHQQLNALRDWIVAFDPKGKTRRQFWAALEAEHGRIRTLAWADDADEQLRELYVDIMALTDDMGYDGPEESMDEVLG